MSLDWRFEFPVTEEEQAFDWSNPHERQEMGRSLVKTFEQMVQGYHEKVNAEGVDVKITKKARKGRRVQQQPDARSQTSNLARKNFQLSRTSSWDARPGPTKT